MSERSRRITRDLPTGMLASEGVLSCCSRRNRATRRGKWFASSFQRTMDATQLKREYAEYWNNWIEHLHKTARCFLQLGIVFNVSCAALLLGMYFQSSYPDTPEMWMLYSFTVTLGLVTFLLFFIRWKCC